jgi:hypothetical protein
MSKIKTKFKCNQVSLFEHGEVVELEVVTHGAKENKSLSDLHASGKLQIRIDKSGSAANYFSPGEEYFLEFSNAPKTVVPPKDANVN